MNFTLKSAGMLPSTPDFLVDGHARWAWATPKSGWFRFSFTGQGFYDVVLTTRSSDFEGAIGSRMSMSRDRLGTWSVVCRLSDVVASLEVQWAGSGGVAVARLNPVSVFELLIELGARGLLSFVANPLETLRKAVPVLRSIARGSLAALPNVAAAHLNDRDYQSWLVRHDSGPPPLVTDLQITLITPVYRPNPVHFDAMIASVKGQTHCQWRLILSDDGNADAALTAKLAALSADDGRVMCVASAKNGGISAALNLALQEVKVGWVGVLDQDDCLHSHALGDLAQGLVSNPQAHIAYTDEDKLNGRGERVEANLKPDWNPELLLGQNYLNHLTIFRAEEALRLEGFRSAFDGAQDWDLYFRLSETCSPAQVVHVAKPRYHWRISPNSTASSMGAKPEAQAAGLHAVQAALDRIGNGDLALSLPGAPYVTIQRNVPRDLPRVSILIPTRDRPDLIERCVQSILNLTDYGNYEVVILDNGSVEPSALAALAELSVDTRVRVLRLDYPFNFARLNNDGAKASDAPLLALVNDDVEILARNWLKAMVGEALRPEIGPVGAKLLYPDNTLQHGGIILGPGGVAGHDYRGATMDEAGPFHQLRLLRRVSAVTAACMVVRRDVWVAVGGMDALNFGVAWNDVDFCLRCAERGFHTVWTPEALARHWESQSRGDDGNNPERAAERARFVARWNTKLASDPFRNPAFDPMRESRAFRP
jgi:GT2 family glycosyltransferase